MKKILLLLIFTAFIVDAGLPPTTTRGSGDSSPKTTFGIDFDTVPLIHTGTNAKLGIIPVTQGGTGSTTQNFVDLTTNQSAAGNKTFTGDTTTKSITLTDSTYGVMNSGEEFTVSGSTGVRSGGVLSVNAVTSKFDMAAVKGWIVNSSNFASVSKTYVNCPTTTANTVTNLATQDVTYILIDAVCAITQQATFPTPSQKRAKVFIGRLNHGNRTSISFADTFPDILQSPSSQYFDLVDAIAPFSYQGNLITANGANLSMNKSTGKIYNASFNYVADNQNPNNVTTAARTLFSFVPETQSSSATARTTLDVVNYDVGGTVTAVPGAAATATVQRVYLFPSNNLVVQYGQATYANLAAAINGYQNESFVENPTVSGIGVLIAYIAVQKNCTSLLDLTRSQIIIAPKFGGSTGAAGAATTNLQQAYDNSSQPEILTNSTIGSIQFKRGSAADSDKVFEILNGAGSSTASVTGAGNLSANTLTSTVAIGTAPLSVTSTTLVPLLYVARAALADTVTTNANLTGPITSVGNATSIASQTGTGTTFVMSAAPTITGHPTIEGVTSTGATGTGKLVFDNGPGFSTNLGIGAVAASNIALGITTTLNSASTQYGIFAQTMFRENTTVAATGVYSQVRTGNPAYTLPNAYAFEAAPASLGTSSAITNATGLMVRDQTVGTGSKYGIQNEVASGTNKWGYYGSGTAANFFAGQVGIGSSSINANAVLDVQSTTQAFMPPRMTTTQKNAIASPAAGMQVFDTTLNSMSYYDGTAWGFGVGNLLLDTVYSAQVSSSGVISNLNVAGWLSGNCVVTNTAQYDCPVRSGLTTNTMTCTGISIDNGFSGINIKQDIANSSATSQRIRSVATSTGAAFANAFTLMCQKTGVDYANSSSSVFTGTSANYDWTSFTPTFTGFGTTTTNACKHRRVGGDLEVMCSFVTGTTAASLASITLPNSLTLDTARLNLSNTTSTYGPMVGEYGFQSASGFGSMVTATGTSTSLVYFGNLISNSTNLVPQNGSAIIGNTQNGSFKFKVPISGWSNISQVVANISGYGQAPGVAGTSNPNIDTFTVSYGTTNASTICSGTPCFIDQIGTAVSSITRSSSGVYPINFAKIYTKLKCVANAIATSVVANTNSVQCSNCNTVTLNTYNTSSTAGDTYGTLYCQGQY